MNKYFQIVLGLLKKMTSGCTTTILGFPQVARMVTIRSNTGRILIGKNFISKSNSQFIAVEKGQLTIGDRFFCNRNTIIVCRNKITIGDDCKIGPGVHIYDHDHLYNAQGDTGSYRTGEIIIGNGCWIGAGAIILRNTYIGNGCIIGAGTVVKGDIPAHSLVTATRTNEIKPLHD